MEYRSNGLWSSDSIFHRSITPLSLSAMASLLQPQQWQHLVNKSARLAELILRGETQHRRGDTHVDPFLNEASAIFRRPVRQPHFDQALGRISRSVVMIEIVFGFAVCRLLIVVDIDHAVDGAFKVGQILVSLVS